MSEATKLTSREEYERWRDQVEFEKRMRGEDSPTYGSVSYSATEQLGEGG